VVGDGGGFGGGDVDSGGGRGRVCIVAHGRFIIINVPAPIHPPTVHIPYLHLHFIIV